MTMEKTIFEQLDGTYTQQGDYLLPDIKLPEQPEYEIGICGNCRRRFLRQHNRIKYYNMLTKCTLYPHLANVEQQAQEMFFRLADEMAKREGLTERLSDFVRPSTAGNSAKSAGRSPHLL